MLQDLHVQFDVDPCHLHSVDYLYLDHCRRKFHECGTIGGHRLSFPTILVAVATDPITY